MPKVQSKTIKNTKSQSGVIAAVLLILIVIVAAMAVMSFVIPFVKDKLDSGGCLEVAGEVEITNKLDYTCYNITDYTMHLQIKYKDIENLTKGFQILVGSSGGSESFEVFPGPAINNITMLNGTSTLVLPGKNEERTYVFGGITSIPESIEVYPILLNGETCEGDSLTSISGCLS